MKKLQRAYDELRQLNDLSLIVYVGANGDRDQDFMSMIVRLMEFGTQGVLGGPIRPKNGKWLTIPTPLAGNKTAREIPGLFIPKGKRVLVMNNGAGFDIYFYLVKEVRIPKRPFLRPTMQMNARKYRDKMKECVNRILIDDQFTAKMAMETLGEMVVSDVKRLIKHGRYVPNAKLTLQNKHGTKPLIDTGAMLNGVTYKVVSDSGRKL